MKTSPSKTGQALPASLITMLALLTALDAMAIDMYLPAMPKIAEDLGVSSGRVQQTLSIFLGGLAVGQCLYGPLLDRFGRRAPLLSGIALFAAGSVMAALAGAIEWLLVARFLQALGAAAGLVAPRAIVADRCSLNDSARVFAILMQVMMIGPILAPIAGGFLLSHGTWPLVFWTLTLLSLGALVWGYFAVPDSLPLEKRVPLEPRTILHSYGSLLWQPAFMGYTISSGLILGSFFTYISGSAFVFTDHFDLTPTQFSYVFAANSVGLVLGGFLSTKLLRNGMAATRILSLGILLHLLAGLLLFMLIRAFPAGVVLYGGVLGLSIAALGLVFGNLTALTMQQAGPRTGVASALMGTLQYLISALIGLLASYAPAGPSQMPATIFLCGLLALALTRFTARISAQPSMTAGNRIITIQNNHHDSQPSKS